MNRQRLILIKLPIYEFDSLCIRAKEDTCGAQQILIKNTPDRKNMVAFVIKSVPQPCRFVVISLTSNANFLHFNLVAVHDTAHDTGKPHDTAHDTALVPVHRDIQCIAAPLTYIWRKI